MQANSWHQKLFHFHLSFCIWKVWKRREKLQKFWYLENKKSFSFGEKNKRLIKNSGHKLLLSYQKLHFLNNLFSSENLEKLSNLSMTAITYFLLFKKSVLLSVYDVWFCV